MSANDMILRLAEQGRNATTKHRYGPLFNDLVKHIDKVSPLAKDGGAITKALKLLETIETKVKDDDQWMESDGAKGLNQHAPQQWIDELRTNLEKLQEHAKRVEKVYDDMNESFLKMGIK
jgi:hypothetical protein